MATGYVKPTP